MNAATTLYGANRQCGGVMMHIPAGKIWERLAAQQTGIWLDASSEPPGFVIIAKLPMGVVRAIRLGVAISLRAWVVDIDGSRAAMLGLQIDDHPEHPLVSFSPVRGVEELGLLRLLLATTTVFTIQVHNEVTLPLVGLRCRLGNPMPTSGSNPLGPELESVGEHGVSIQERAMDAIESTLEPMASPDPRILKAFNQPLVVDVVEGLRSFVAGAGEFQPDDPDQGKELERLALATFDHLCSFGAYHQPWVVEGSGKQRELCDVLALARIREYPHEGIFVVESKVTATTAQTLSRTESRRAAVVEKHIHQAVGQLCGAIKRLKRGDKILRADGTPIEIDPPSAIGLVEPLDLKDRAAKVGHAIVLVSDMQTEADWSAIAKLLFQASQETEYLFHVLDLRELQRMIAFSNGRPVMMEANLVRRWEAMKKGGSALLRGLPEPPK